MKAKLLVVKSLIIPIMIYGRKLYGFNQLRQTLMDRVIKMIVRRSNLCILQACKELKIKILPKGNLITQVKYFYKWRSLRIIISDLICTTECSFRYSWCWVSSIWLRINISWHWNHMNKKNWFKLPNNILQLKKNRKLINTTSGA